MTLPPPSPPKSKKRLRVQDFSDISSEEDEITVAPPCPPKRSRAPEVVVCEPDIVYQPDIVILGGSSSPAKKPEKPDIIYLGSYSRKTSPPAPPNSPTYPPPPTVPQTIWFEGVSSVYPVQVIVLVILTLYYIFDIFR